MKMRALIIGGFSKAKPLANYLIDRGYRVTAINSDKENCLELAELAKLTVVHGDGSSPAVLEDANANHADIAIALTGRDDINLVICELCKRMFHVIKTVALVSDPSKAEFFQRMGVDSVVCMTTSIIDIIEQPVFTDQIAAVGNCPKSE